MKLHQFFFVVGIIFLTASICSARVYRYVDERGIPCYTDDIYNVPEAQRPDVGTVDKSAGAGRSPEEEANTEGSVEADEQRRIDHLSRQLLSRAGRGDVETVKDLLERGADIHTRDKQGETVLMKAARVGNFPVVKLLIEYGAEVNAIDVTGGTALSYAKSFGQEEVATLLRSHGAVQ
jgi:hypothetical protein